MRYLIFALFVLFSSCSNTDNNKKLYNTVTINGVDISHHNKVKWDSLNNCNLKFVYIKASEGASFKDPKRVENYKIAKEKYLVGFYTFWRKGISGEEHYKNFRNSIEGCTATLPPVLDLEDGVRDTTYQKELMKQVDIFSKLYIKDFGEKPIIYTWYDSAIQLHKINSSYKYWLNIGSRFTRNPHKPINIETYDKVPWIILQCGKWDFGSGDIDLNYSTFASSS